MTPSGGIGIMELSELRKQLDEIDRDILHLYVRRMDVITRIAAVKADTGAPVRDPDREAEILLRAAESAGPRYAPYAEALFRSILAQSRAYQTHLSKDTQGGEAWTTD